MGCCCSRCFTNKHIQNFIEAHAQTKGNCDYCGASNVAVIGTDVLGEHIRECIGNAYVDSEEGSGAFWDPEFHVYCGPGGGEPTYYSVRSILSEEEDALSDAVLDTPLVDDMMQDSSNSSIDEYDEFRDPDCEWLLKKYDVFCHDKDEAFEQWEFFKEFLCCASAFSDTPFENPRAKKYLDVLRPYLERFAGEVRPGDIFFRVRTGTLDFSKMDVYAELGPAPQCRAECNRMSEAGVPRLYLASDVDTAVTECKAADKDCVVATYVAKEALPTIDFSKPLPETRRSIFDPDFKDEDLWLGDFLHGLAKEISKPLVKGATTFEYKGTQAVAEYIRCMGFRGICYKSSVGEGKSYVFFCGPDPEHHSEKTEAYSFLQNLIYLQDEIQLPTPFTSWFNITKVVGIYRPRNK